MFSSQGNCKKKNNNKYTKIKQLSLHNFPKIVTKIGPYCLSNHTQTYQFSILCYFGLFYLFSLIFINSHITSLSTSITLIIVSQAVNAYTNPNFLKLLPLCLLLPSFVITSLKVIFQSSLLIYSSNTELLYSAKFQR